MSEEQNDESNVIPILSLVPPLPYEESDLRTHLADIIMGECSCSLEKRHDMVQTVLEIVDHYISIINELHMTIEESDSEDEKNLAKDLLEFVGELY